ncbi:hypothetical protein P3T76_007427 [Phytophthora citrophthora]|uniref:Uncharacterized protein n=1 Tax=Phytophthora citrophthora TaxID=4793 RepID=A0AAD9GN91_9STRA|nr:hypothetical protein P3T76_007427 [Phytophthora citrophthora]
MITNDAIEMAYYLKVLSEILLQDQVLTIIQARQIGDLSGPVSKPPTTTDRLNAVKVLLDLLQEASLVAGVRSELLIRLGTSNSSDCDSRSI